MAYTKISIGIKSKDTIKIVKEATEDIQEYLIEQTKTYNKLYSDIPHDILSPESLSILKCSNSTHTIDTYN